MAPVPSRHPSYTAPLQSTYCNEKSPFEFLCRLNLVISCGSDSGATPYSWWRPYVALRTMTTAPASSQGMRATMATPQGSLVEVLYKKRWCVSPLRIIH